MSVSTVYRYIVDDVIKNIREEFAKEGIEEHILIRLQAEWEQKINQTTAIGSEEYTNNAYTPKRMAPPYAQGQSFDYNQYNETSTPQEYHTPYQTINTPQGAQLSQGAAHEYSEYTGRPQSFMPPPNSWNTEQEVNVSQSKPAQKPIKPDPDARPRKTGSRGIHQNDGANDDIDLDNVKDKYEKAKIVDKQIAQMIKKKTDNSSRWW